MKRPLTEWLYEPVYQFSSNMSLSVGECVEGVSIMGATGSGKSSSSGKQLAVGMLRTGFGGLVLCAKSDELQTWLGYYREAFAQDPGFDAKYEGDPAQYDPRETGKLVVIGTTTKYRFNPIAYEYSLAVEDAAATASSRLVNLFMSALGSAGGHNSSADPYWSEALRELLTHAVDLVRFAQGEVSEAGEFITPATAPSLQQLQDIIRTAPQSPTEAESKRWQQSDGLCPTFLRQAYLNYEKSQASGNSVLSEVLGDFLDTFQYWLKGFAGLAERTRSVVVSSFTAKASGLLRAPLRSLLCSEGKKAWHRSATPAAMFDGQVVLVDLPVKSFGEVGRFAQMLIKTDFQHATDAKLRRVEQPGYPVFLWADEAQNFVSSEDVMFQCTARSKLCSTVYLTQNLPNYHTQLGGASSSATSALLGSLGVKIFHCNGDPETNEWAERILGTEESKENQDSESRPHMGSGGGSTSKTKVFRRIPFVPAYEFSSMHLGGRPIGRSEAIVFMAGKPWKTCRKRDEVLEQKLITQGISGRGIKHLFLQQGSREHCREGASCEICFPQS